MHTNIKVPQEIKMHECLTEWLKENKVARFSKVTTKSRFMELYSGNILITLKLDLSRDLFRCRIPLPLTTEESYLGFKHLTRVI